jgi:endoglucanase
VGGIQPTALAGKSVRFENGVYGVIGLKPMHLCEGDERLTLPEVRELTIDIGAADREAAAARVRPGDAAVFTNEFVALGGGKVLSKAIDDRAGCAVMLDMIRTGMEYDTVFCFNVQEEVGLRGATVSAFSVAPDYALVLEATTAADIIDAPEEKQVCVLGKGPAVSFMDNATVYDPALFKKALALAEENGIPAQPKTMVAGGNDAGSVHKSRAGVRTLTVSVPCRYIHSASCVCDKNDVLATRQLAEKLNEYFAMA